MISVEDDNRSIEACCNFSRLFGIVMIACDARGDFAYLDAALAVAAGLDPCFGVAM